MSIWRAGSLQGIVGMLLLSLLSLLLPVSAHATDITENLSVRGFYTLDATYSGINGAAPPTLAANPSPLNKGAVRFDGSLLGLQADYALGDYLNLTLQAISTSQINNSYSPTLDWAYLNYDFGNDLHLHAGKMKIALLQGTELRYVGFSRLWVRPLVPNSGAGGFDNYAGAELIKDVSAGKYNMRFQASYGKADHQQNFVHDHDIKLLSSRIEKNESWVNVALLQASYRVDTPSGRTLNNNAELVMGSIETELLLGNAVINAGYTNGHAEINPDEQLAYLSFGYRINRLTPYLLLSERKMTFNTPGTLAAFRPPPTLGLPPPQQDGTKRTNTVALGFRYDLGASYAIKGQVEHGEESQNNNPLGADVVHRGNLFTLVFEGVF